LPGSPDSRETGTKEGALSPEELDQRRRVAEEAAKAAAAVHRRYFGAGLSARTKNDNPRDLVSQADVESQAAAKAVIEAAFPGEAILGEEDEGALQAGEGRLAACWLIDPLDGSFSFLHDFPFFASTVCWVESGLPLAGCVYATMQDEMFAAAAGRGATLNGQPISIRRRRPLAEAVLGLPAARSPEGIAALTRLITAVQGVRIFLPSSLTLSYVACGRLDAAATLMPLQQMGPWDIAAGALLVEEAGGAVGSHGGAPFDLRSKGYVGASSSGLLRQLVEAGQIAPEDGLG